MLFLIYTTALAAAAWKLRAVARTVWSLVRRPKVSVLGKCVATPRTAPAELLDAFTPLAEWTERARGLVGTQGVRSLDVVALKDARVVSNELLSLTVRCRARLEHKTELVDVVLTHPTAVLVLWCRDLTRGVGVLVITEDQFGALRRVPTLPYGRNVDGTFKGGTLQQLRMETGLTVADASRVEGVGLEPNPRCANERFEYYSAEVPHLHTLLDADEERRASIVPLSSLLGDARGIRVLLQAERFFPAAEPPTP